MISLGYAKCEMQKAFGESVEVRTKRVYDGQNLQTKPGGRHIERRMDNERGNTEKMETTANMYMKKLCT